MTIAHLELKVKVIGNMLILSGMVDNENEKVRTDILTDVLMSLTCK